MRFKARVDNNQHEIVNTFRKLGASVLSLASIGKGIPDLLVAYKGVTWLVEVKTLKGKETDDQIKFALSWKGKRVIVRSADEAFKTFQEIVKESYRLTYLL